MMRHWKMSSFHSIYIYILCSFRLGFFFCSLLYGLDASIDYTPSIHPKYGKNAITSPICYGWKNREIKYHRIAQPNFPPFPRFSTFPNRSSSFRILFRHRYSKKKIQVLLLHLRKFYYIPIMFQLFHTFYSR